MFLDSTISRTEGTSAGGTLRMNCSSTASGSSGSESSSRSQPGPDSCPPVEVPRPDFLLMESLSLPALGSRVRREGRGTGAPTGVNSSSIETETKGRFVVGGSDMKSGHVESTSLTIVIKLGRSPERARELTSRLVLHPPSRAPPFPADSDALRPRRDVRAAALVGPPRRDRLLRCYRDGAASHGSPRPRRRQEASNGREAGTRCYWPRASDRTLGPALWHVEAAHCADSHHEERYCRCTGPLSASQRSN